MTVRGTGLAAQAVESNVFVESLKKRGYQGPCTYRRKVSPLGTPPKFHAHPKECVNPLLGQTNSWNGTQKHTLRRGYETQLTCEVVAVQPETSESLEVPQLRGHTA